MGTIAQDYLDQIDSIKLIQGNLKIKDVPSFDIHKVLKKAGHQLTNMIDSCQFAGKICTLKDFTPTLSSSVVNYCSLFVLLLLVIISTTFSKWVAYN